MIDIETASRSVDIVIGLAVLAVIAVVFFAWILIKMNNVENTMKIKKAVNRAVESAKEQCYREMMSKGAASFSEKMELKRVIKEQTEQIRKLTSENQRMQSIIERASR